MQEYRKLSQSALNVQYYIQISSAVCTRPIAPATAVRLRLIHAPCLRYWQDRRNRACVLCVYVCMSEYIISFERGWEGGLVWVGTICPADCAPNRLHTCANVVYLTKLCLVACLFNEYTQAHAELTHKAASTRSRKSLRLAHTRAHVFNIQTHTLSADDFWRTRKVARRPVTVFCYLTVVR